MSTITSNQSQSRRLAGPGVPVAGHYSCCHQHHTHRRSRTLGTVLEVEEEHIHPSFLAKGDVLCLQQPQSPTTPIPRRARHDSIDSRDSWEQAGKIPPRDCQSTVIAKRQVYRQRTGRARPLLSSIQTDFTKMQAVDAIVPDSPPDLTTASTTSSTSSKSSSLRSSLDTERHDVSHFEDIGLNDINTGLPLEFGKTMKSVSNHPLKRRPEARILTGHNASPTKGRDVGRPNHQDRRNQANHATNGERTGSIPIRHAMRGFTSPSAPSLVNHRQIARSVSPTARLAYANSSPRLPTRSSPGHISPGEAFADRRKSWQGNMRKTVQQLEDECGDSDDELPEDADIFNLPLSPRPPHERSSSSSPERRLELPAPKHNSAPPLGSENSPPNSLHPNYPITRSVSTPAKDPYLKSARTKSWTTALSGMSEEARILTAALEEHASSQDRLTAISLQVQSRGRSKPSAPQRPIAEKRAATTTVLDLPPIQKANILIDPLPVSKEKAAVLSRTRPSWLPPKSKKEEEKHLREYQRIMAAAKRAEELKAEKQRLEQLERDEKYGSLSRIWEEHVLPNWDKVLKEPRTRELWWRGVTPRSRGIVWSKAIGNDLVLTDRAYPTALDRANKLKAKLDTLSPEARAQAKESSWFEAIEKDACTAFPELQIFQMNGPLHQPLVDLLSAYTMYRSDLGYVPGTHLPAALLLLNLSPMAAFVALANLLNRPLPSHFLTKQTSNMANAGLLVMQTLQYKRPKLHEHFTKLEIKPEEWLDTWFGALFCNLGVDAASRIWDVYVFEGDRACIRAAVGTVLALEGKLYGEKEEALRVLTNAGDEWRKIRKSEEEFVGFVREAGKADKTSPSTTPLR